MGGAEGFDHTGRVHSTHYFELADQPIAVTVSVDEKAAQGLLDALAAELIDVTYVKVAMEHGRIGAKSSSSSAGEAQG